MNNIVIFLIIFLAILILMYPIMRIIYFLTAKKNKRNKILNLIIIIISFISIYFIIRAKINNVMDLNLGKVLNVRKELAFFVVTLLIGSFAETIINTVINFFIKRRVRNR